MSRYTVLLYREPDGSAYNVVVPSMPGCHTYGATVEEALANAQEAAALWLEVTAEQGDHVPEPDDRVIVASIEVVLDAAASPIGAA